MEAEAKSEHVSVTAVVNKRKKFLCVSFFLLNLRFTVLYSTAFVLVSTKIYYIHTVRCKCVYIGRNKEGWEDY